jgi:hypothetical protein
MVVGGGAQSHASGGAGGCAVSFLDGYDFRSIRVEVCPTCMDTGMARTAPFAGEAEPWIPYAWRAESLRIASGLDIAASAVMSGALGPRPCPSCMTQRREPAPASFERLVAMADQTAAAAAARVMIEPNLELASEAREVVLLVRATIVLRRPDLIVYRSLLGFKLARLTAIAAKYEWISRPRPLPLNKLRDYLEEFPVDPEPWERAA